MNCSSSLRGAQAWRRRASALLLCAGLAACAAPHPKVVAAAPAPPPPSAALARFADARAEELGAAQQASQELLAATAALPPAEQVRPRGLASTGRTVADPRTLEMRKVEVFDSLTVDLPLSLRGRPAHDAAMAAVRRLAEVLAARRGAAEVARLFAAPDVRNEKIGLAVDTVQPAPGQQITVARRSDPDVLRGFERIVVKGGPVPPPQ